MSAKGEYMMLLEINELLSLYPTLTGDWKKDKEEFTKMWEANKDVFNEFDIDYEELGDED